MLCALASAFFTKRTWLRCTPDVNLPSFSQPACCKHRDMRRARHGLRPSRALVVFGFGLLHGLGFASVLSDFGLPTSAFVVGLVSFNIGVEIGQLLIVLPVFLVLKAMKLSAPTFRRGFQLPVSAVISVTRLFWVAERTGLIGIF